MCKSQKTNYTKLYTKYQASLRDISFMQSKLIELTMKIDLLEKALELACEEINRVEAKFGSAYIRANGYLVDYFKNEAKEMMKSE